MTNNLLNESTQIVLDLVREYARLSTLEFLTERDSFRLWKILEESTRNEILDFWINEVDHFVGHHLGLLNEKSRNSYSDQQALLREHIGISDSLNLEKTYPSRRTCL